MASFPAWGGGLHPRPEGTRVEARGSPGRAWAHRVGSTIFLGGRGNSRTWTYEHTSEYHRNSGGGEAALPLRPSSRDRPAAFMMEYQAGQVVELTMRDVAHGGWCVARPEDGPVVFVRHTLPGETVLARLTEVTSRLARADAVEILTPSPDRVDPPCPHAHPGGCGGCDRQHATLPAQRSLKAAVGRQQLKRLAGGGPEVTVEPLPGDEEPGGERAGGEDAGPVSVTGTGAGLGWRTRVQFAVRADGVAGLRAHRSHDVIDVGQ